MNEQERADLQRFSAMDSRLTTLETNFAVFTQEMKDFKQEMRDFKNEMRQQNQMRADEVKEIRQSIDGMNKHVRNLSYTSIAAIAAMVITVLLNLPK